ncbi:MAG TPA: hypothetical protein VK956_06625, partial [Verrucomicrobium sp.]|nr:hypothetical protein [Verrucomicrobium sp.]
MSSVLPFARRHIGPSPSDATAMAQSVGCETLDQLIDSVVPEVIRRRDSLQLPAPLGEEQALRKLKQTMGRNQLVRSFIGLGYHDTFTPPV